MRPVEEFTTVKSDQPLLEVVKLLEQGKLSALAVIRDNGALVGILEKASILNLLEKRAQANPA
jgi:CBS domain-containing protein